MNPTANRSPWSAATSSCARKKVTILRTNARPSSSTVSRVFGFRKGRNREVSNGFGSLTRK